VVTNAQYLLLQFLHVLRSRRGKFFLCIRGPLLRADPPRLLHTLAMYTVAGILCESLRTTPRRTARRRDHHSPHEHPMASWRQLRMKPPRATGVPLSRATSRDPQRHTRPHHSGKEVMIVETTEENGLELDVEPRRPMRMARDE
jgi:hypothetical protein